MLASLRTPPPVPPKDGVGACAVGTTPDLAGLVPNIQHLFLTKFSYKTSRSMQHVTDVAAAFSISKIWVDSVSCLPGTARSGALSQRFLPLFSIVGQAKIRSSMLVVPGLLTPPRVLLLPRMLRQQAGIRNKHIHPNSPSRTQQAPPSRLTTRHVQMNRKSFHKEEVRMSCVMHAGDQRRIGSVLCRQISSKEQDSGCRSLWLLYRRTEQ
ncbi:uncharacterized protein LOC123411084 [Hordeum vulgare subsp. vulgare]|uniref:uncharacterized protein LOC123411084 n=1 Tax=Hordeum vulgare subsp. vulgare TaxID=112509 RepID=UPI001D1A4719|nr:uncharacterized protein LOC123411084 [Hordeum vulgare subsp. vulgare]